VSCSTFSIISPRFPVSAAELIDFLEHFALFLRFPGRFTFLLNA